MEKINKNNDDLTNVTAKTKVKGKRWGGGRAGVNTIYGKNSTLDKKKDNLLLRTIIQFNMTIYVKKCVFTFAAEVSKQNNQNNDKRYK